MTEQQTVAVIGAGGTMGFALAGNLARAGFPVRAWNRTQATVEPLAADGAVICHTPHEAVRGADVILTVLPDAGATQTVMFDDDGALTAITGEPIWLQMGTIGAHGTAECMEVAARRGLAFVDAQMSGTKEPAEQGELLILASGDPAMETTLKPLLDVIGKKTLWVGGSGAGTELKLIVNSWLVSIIEGIAESMALAEGLGVDPQQFLDAVKGGALDVEYLHLKGQKIIDRDFEPSFSLSSAAKDAGLVMAVAERHGLDLPVLGAIHTRLKAGAAEHGDEDAIATYRLSARRTAPR